MRCAPLTSFLLPSRPKKQSYKHGRHKWEQDDCEAMPETIISRRGQAQSTLHVYLPYFHRKLSNCFVYSFSPPKSFLAFDKKKKKRTDRMLWRIIWSWNKMANWLAASHNNSIKLIGGQDFPAGHKKWLWAGQASSFPRHSNERAAAEQKWLQLSKIYLSPMSHSMYLPRLGRFELYCSFPSLIP